MGEACYGSRNIRSRKAVKEGRFQLNDGFDGGSIRGRCANCGYEVNWKLLQVMAQSAVDKIPPGPKLDVLTAEKIFG
jgi:hypothetical protein